MRFSNLSIFCLLPLLVCAQAAGANRPGVAATVNGVDITENRLQSALDNHIREQGSDVGAIRQPAEFKEIRARVLEVLIGQELLWQAARMTGNVAGDDEVESVFERYRSQFADDLEFDNRLRSAGFTRSEFREDLRRRLSAQNWIRANLLGKISVNGVEISDFYRENKQMFAIPAQMRARHILIKLDQGASEQDVENARTLLADLRQRVAGGEDFAELAREYSQDGSAARGGDLGYFGPGQMVKSFEKAAFGLAAGEVSNIVQTRFGLHLIQALEHRPSAYYTEEEAAEGIREHLFRQKYETSIDAALEDLKQGAEIEYHNL